MENDNIINDPGQPVTEPEQPGKIQAEAIDQTTGEMSFWQRLQENKKLYGFLRKLGLVLVNVAALFLIFIFLIYVVPALQEIPSGGKTHLVNSEELKKGAPYKKRMIQMKKDIDHLSIKYNNYTTGQSYLVINTTDNLFYLYKNKKLIRSGHCSTGSYMMLKTAEGRSWVFKTPKGKRDIQGKNTHPYWHRSDWSYIEEGTPVPPKDDPSRWEYGVLGDYSMSLGDGYMIHGTIYKRFLGMPVTHGCVRLNDADLDVVFHALNIGSKVYIF
jgi:lipoprotein-anchoring transpeptidase ErfK/SrfK